MKNLSQAIFIILGLGFLTSCIQYNISPPSRTVQTNQTFTMDISIDSCLRIPVFKRRAFCADTSDVYGVGFDLNYNSSIITYQGISLTGCVLSNVTSLTGFRNSSNDNGKLVVGVSKQGQVSGQSGQGKIATITFKALAQGNTTITVADPHLISSQGKSLLGRPFSWVRLGQASISVVP